MEKGIAKEQDLRAELERSFRRQGATFLAFPPVVAGGSRTTTLHYGANDQLIRLASFLLWLILRLILVRLEMVSWC